MKVKYSETAEPLRKEQSGITYLKPSGLKYAARGQANDRNRNKRQTNRKGNLMAAARHWRNLQAVEKAAWNGFAATFPQACKYAPSGFLTGYQIFIKRQHYCFLNYGLSNEFLAAPMQRELLPVTVEFSIGVFDNVIDVSENFIMNFGILPTAGQKLLFKCLPMAINSGQFFPIVEKVLTVDEVYMDGLFVSLSIAPHSVPIVWSVYLSKPISNGRKYSGTKTRYMGCFTSKTFLQLLDTPSSYEGQAGLTVKVKPDETGLEFGEGGGGGLTCETLPACQTIISIQADINALNQIINPTPPEIWLFAEGTSLYRSVDGFVWQQYLMSFNFYTETNFLYVREWRLWIAGSVRPAWAVEIGTVFYLSVSTVFSNARKAAFDGKGLAVMTGYGTANSLAFSADGKIWQGLGTAALGQYGQGICFAAGIWVAGSFNNGQANTLAYSFDGVTWVGVGKTTFTTECASIAYGNGLFVAVGRGTVTAAYSVDGITWVRSSNVFGTKGWVIKFGFGHFVVVATSGIWKSLDGVTWSLVHPDAGGWGTATMGAIAFSTTHCIVRSSTVQKISSDLITWVDVDPPSGKAGGGCTIDPFNN